MGYKTWDVINTKGVLLLFAAVAMMYCTGLLSPPIWSYQDNEVTRLQII